MKRWVWTVAAAVPIVVGVAWWLVPSSADVAVNTAIHPDGTVEWVDGEFRRAEENNSAVYELPGDKHVSRLADDVVIRTAQGCATTGEITLSWRGLGDVECSRDEFLAMRSAPYAPRLTFNRDGEITGILGRYHP
jgi:hypothetical protein